MTETSTATAHRLSPDDGSDGDSAVLPGAVGLPSQSLPASQPASQSASLPASLPKPDPQASKSTLREIAESGRVRNRDDLNSETESGPDGASNDDIMLRNRGHSVSCAIVPVCDVIGEHVTSHFGVRRRGPHSQEACELNYPSQVVS